VYEHCQRSGKRRQPSIVLRNALTGSQRQGCCGGFSTRWWIVIEKPINSEAETSKATEIPRPRFCALGYRAQGRSEDGPIILLVIQDGSVSVRFLVHPNWRAIVQAEDLDYIESLLLDFPDRAAMHWDALFKHLCSLRVGPLVTQETGESISDHPALFELCSAFAPL
jgi:hypothetical protein